MRHGELFTVADLVSECEDSGITLDRIGITLFRKLTVGDAGQKANHGFAVSMSSGKLIGSLVDFAGLRHLAFHDVIAVRGLSDFSNFRRTPFELRAHADATACSEAKSYQDECRESQQKFESRARFGCGVQAGG